MQKAPPLDRAGAMIIRGRRTPFTTLTCFSEVAPNTENVFTVMCSSSHGSPSASGVKPIDGVVTTSTRSRASLMPGTSSSGPRTINAPVAPDATWMAVVPWMCG